MNRKEKKIFSLVIMACVCFELVFIIVTWMITMVSPESQLHSIFDDGGIRMLLSQYANPVHYPHLILLAILSMMISAVKRCRLMIAMHRKSDKDASCALWCAATALAIVISLAMAFYPHSPFLSVMGDIWSGVLLKAVFLILAAARL